MSDRQTAAFMSYVHSDDDHDQGSITDLRQRLEGEVKAQTGKPFPIFQDRNDIRWGQQWEERITKSLIEHVTFLIPIVTPSFFESPACRQEFETFVLREKTLGVQFLVLPIYYITCDQLDHHKKGVDHLADILVSRQWTDWRTLRFKNHADEKVRTTIAAMGMMIKKSIREFAEIKAASDASAAVSIPKKRKASRKPSSSSPSTPLPPPVPPRFRALESDHVIELRPKGTKLPASELKRPSAAYYAYTKRFDEVVHARDLVDKLRESLLHGRLVQTAEELKQVWPEELEGMKRFAAKRHKVSATVLIDNSGSLRGRPIECVAGWMLVLAEVFDFLGIRSEFLGFTTRGWRGGQSRELWQIEGKQPSPGRLNALRHIVYKSFNESALESAATFGVMLNEWVLKENIDGEAILWAHSRLAAEQTGRRLLFVISDGAPVDDATLSLNDSTFLIDHLEVVVDWIETCGLVSMYGVGIEHDVSRYYTNSVRVPDASAVGIPILTALERIFASS